MAEPYAPWLGGGNGSFLPVSAWPIVGRADAPLRDPCTRATGAEAAPRRGRVTSRYPVDVIPCRRPRRFVLLAAFTVVLLVVAGCRAAGPSFDPAGPCAADGRQPGAYPDLEALVPTTFEGRPPSRLDSGRNCSPRNLGTLASHGLTEVRFAGGLWETGKRSGVTLAVFRADGLSTAWLFEFYQAGAQVATLTDAIVASNVTVGGLAGRRLDTLNDESFQTVIVWPATTAGTEDVVIVASDIREVGTRAAHEATVVRAVAAWGLSLEPAPAPSPSG